MAESIFVRISRVLSATIEDSVDQLERAGGEAVMREAIREADRAVDQVRAELESVTSRRLGAARQQGMLDKRVEELTGKAKFAVGEGREDLAEAALSRQIDFETESKRLGDVQAQAREEEGRLVEGLAALKTRKAQMVDALSAYLAAKRETASLDVGARPRTRSPEKVVEAAEQAFDRAMGGVGGFGMPRSDVDAANRVGEIDAMQKSASIAKRLAALRQEKAA